MERCSSSLSCHISSDAILLLTGSPGHSTPTCVDRSTEGTCPSLIATSTESSSWIATPCSSPWAFLPSQLLSTDPPSISMLIGQEISLILSEEPSFAGKLYWHVEQLCLSNLCRWVPESHRLVGPEAGSSPPHPLFTSLVNSNTISPRHFGESQNREMKGEESISAKQHQEKEVKAQSTCKRDNTWLCLLPQPCKLLCKSCRRVWKCCCKMGPSGVLKACGLAMSGSTNKGCWHSQMDGKCVYFCQGIFYVLSALILQEVAARQEGSMFSGGPANPQHGVSSCSSPAPLLRSFSDAAARRETRNSWPRG